ncbi:MAG: alpha/beta fold hydrolase [Gemmatimonadota bacterium]|nr:alpha/beta fold hydrolase [Gemmatimonadota bacterium]
MRIRHILLSVFAAPSFAAAQGAQGDFVTRNFTFTTGETLPEVRIHYTTLGKPRKDAAGVTRNAVLILHGTGGTGRGFLSRNFGGELLGPGQLLDTAKYFVVLPDNVGHGGSSKPSDGLRAKFPKYTYDDMVQLQHLLLTQGLGVNHLRLVMGTSMGCMHSWVWLYTYPAFMDGAVPLACAPTAIVGRNRMIRAAIIDAIRNDPGYRDGNYTGPLVGMKAAEGFLFMMTSAPLVQQRQAPTRVAADSIIQAYEARGAATTDPNDMVWYFDSSRDYDPSPHLGQVTAPVLHINSADDFVNPPELHIVEPLIARVPTAKFVLIPISDQTRGHGTHSLPAVWGSYLAEFLRTLKER